MTIQDWARVYIAFCIVTSLVFILMNEIASAIHCFVWGLIIGFQLYKNRREE